MDWPLIWGVLIAVAVILYALLDGFDLGVGVLTFFAHDEAERTLMASTIEPVWDGNETWLILGGGGLFAAFPLAYAVLMPAFYIPVLIMLAALIFRGVAFEFRIKAARAGTRRFWNGAFAGGSLTAALAQGAMLGAFVQGVEVDARSYAGGPIDWLTPFSVLVALCVPAGYVLLGACWLILKTEGRVQQDARKWARRALFAVLAGMVAVSLATLSIDPRVSERWGFSMASVDFSRFWKLAPIPLAAAGIVYALFRDIELKPEAAPDWRPIALSAALFLTAYVGFAVSIFPYNVPFALTIWDTAARENALILLGVGASVMLPIILLYTAYVYKLFWGKVRDGEGYHA